MKNDLISDIYNWFVEKKKTIRRWAVIAVIVCPLIIWGFYFVGRFIWGIPTDITADGILDYSAAIISSIATVFLGFITLALSKHANKINDDLLAVQKDQYLLETRPFIMITNWAASGEKLADIIYNPSKIFICVDTIKESVKEVTCLSLFITNTTKSFVLAEFGGGSVLKNGITEKFEKSAENQLNTKLLLNPGETKELVLYGNIDFFANLVGETTTVTFVLENRIAERYIESVNFVIELFPDPFLQGLDQWFVKLSTDEYNVEKVSHK